MASKPTILVTEPLSERAMAYLKQHGDVIVATADTAAQHVASADALVVRTYTKVDRALLDKAPRLKVVGRAGVAIDNIDVPACLARNIAVVHTPAANTLAVVDYTIGMIIQLNRRYWPMKGHLPPEQFHLARGQMFGRFLSGATLGIVGAGRIGSRVGRAAAGMGMKVLYNDIKKIDLDYPAAGVDKETLFASSDIVTIHVPLTDLTRRFVNAQTLAKFKPGAQFINAARGQCVDYHALAEAIRTGQISAAGIDCHDPEPPPPDYPMFAVMGENVILTPHIAARVPAAMEAMCDVVYDIVNVLQGRPPQYPAEPGAY
jgi:D-3-phosphoglycerate dehydrogenase